MRLPGDECSGEIKYDPTFHENHKKEWTEEELAYLCRFYDYDGSRSIGFALGRTERTIRKQAAKLRNNQLFDHYKTLWGI